jgi:isoleucyl-tRNA synthetase
MYKLFQQLNLPEIDNETLEFWKEAGVFERSVSEREGCPNFVFYEGPPSANGQPGIHHVLARSIKDTFCRYQTMKGKLVRRKAGWDTHGLPIELAVEKKLGITKEDIGKKISVEDYNQACRTTVMEFKDRWDDITTKMGYWVDLNNPYITYENDYIESCWWLLNRLYKKGLLYKGLTIQPYSPAAGTGLSSHELNLPGCYKEVSDNTVVAGFKVQRDEKSAFLFDADDEDVRILAWTTTPWTLPSNTALTVGPKINYVKIKTQNPYTNQPVSVVLAVDLVGKWFGGKNQPTELSRSEVFSGTALNAVRYEQLLPFGNEIEALDGATDAFRVICDNFVTTEDGTGVVHTAPSFGADDRKAARANRVGALTLVDKQGKFLDSVGPFSGRFVKNYKDDSEYKSVDVDIVIYLKEQNLAFNAQKYAHNYPHCWRTDKPILYYPLDSWFIKASAAKERMFELNKTINWKPKSTGEGRFGGWLENLQDWNLSRSRFWGIPLPIWRTEDGAEELCIDSVEQLYHEIEKSVAAGLMAKNPFADFKPNDFSKENYNKIDLHKHIVDNIILVSDSAKAMRRESDLIDVWFDSGAMPFAQLHYPFENKELIDNALSGKGGEMAFPADFIAEGVDQTRGWFYTLHAIATMCFDSVSYKNVVSNGLVLDKNGLKMSKRWGNAVDPFYCIGKYGADATRWYMLTNSQPWDNLKFSWTNVYQDAEGNRFNTDETKFRELLKDSPEKFTQVEGYSDGITEVQRKLFGTLYNTYIFFATYANIDAFDGTSIKDFDFNGEVPIGERTEIDRWIISLLNTLVKEVDADYADYEPTQAGRRIEEFVDNNLSNWYVRLCRRRFWKGGQDEDKLAAYQTLYTCLITLSKLMAPIAPFFSEFLYRNLNGATKSEKHDSVHLSYFPVVDEKVIDKMLEERMDYAQRISSMVHSLRRSQKMRVRQPLQKVLLPILDERFEAQVDSVKDLILSEVNVKELEYVKDTSGIIKKGIKPNFKTLGKKLGKLMKAAQDRIAEMTQEDIATIEKNNLFSVELEGEKVDLNLEDVVISSEDLEGWLVANDGDLTVALDVNLTEELKAEGIARELVNRIQNIRKDSDFEVTDRVKLTLQSSDYIKEAVEKFGTYICNEVLATDLKVIDASDFGQEVELEEGLMLRIAVEKN